jgi:hypothetical protein
MSNTNSKKIFPLMLFCALSFAFTSTFALTTLPSGNYYLGIEYGQSAAKLSDSNPKISYPAKFGSVTDAWTKLPLVKD